MAISLVMVTTAVIVVRRKKAGWFALHRKTASLGVLSALIAFMAEFTFKTAMHYPHIKSPHAIAGLVTLILMVITPIIGSQIASNPDKYRPKHKILGKVTLAAVIITALMGMARFIELSRQA